MDDTDTATVELTMPEAMEVVNALWSYQVAAGGEDEVRALEVRVLLQREFGLKDDRFEGEDPVSSAFGDVFDDDDREIRLSRAEASEVVPALADLEEESEPAEAETIAGVRGRFEDAFDLRRENSD